MPSYTITISFDEVKGNDPADAVKYILASLEPKDAARWSYDTMDAQGNHKTVYGEELFADAPAPDRVQAYPHQIEAARELHQTDEVQIDNDAACSPCDDGSFWVQAWVHVPGEEE